MKKTLHIALAAAAAALAAAGCAKVGEPDAPEGQEITITASFADDQTKTTLQDGGTAVYWEAGDEIKVFLDGESGRFASTLTEAAEVSRFKGTISAVIGGGEGYFGDSNLMGLYPYRTDAVSDGVSITTTLPDEQTGRAGSFAKNTNITISTSKTTVMGFYNVCGGVRFSVTRDDVTDVVFESLGEESVAGKVKLAFEGGVPAVQEVVEGVSSITLTAPSGGVFETGKWYYIVALPGTLSGGFKMTFNTEKQYATLKSSSSRTIKRGKFGSLADADEDLVYKDKGTPEPTGDNIVFKDPIAKYACVEKFDTDGDGEVSYDEAAAVTSIAGLFTDYNTVTRFDELKYFTGITGLSSALKGLTALESVTVPAQFTSIEDNAFDSCTALDSISFAGSSINSFGYRSFYKCSSLKTVIIPSGVKSLNKDTFSGCSALTSVSLPSSIEILGDYVFNNCSSLASINLPTNVTSVGQYAFYGCSSLKSLEFPSGVTSISSYCFQRCSSLETIGLPSGLSSIGYYAFSGCTKLEAIEFPSMVKTIGDYAFQNCESLKSVSVPNTVTSLGNNVFNGCSSLESASLPSGLTSIPSGTFSGCTSLCHLTFPESVTEISADAFRYCPFFDKSTGIAKIELPSTVTSIGSRALNNARNVLVTSNSFVTIQSNTFSLGTRIFVPDAKVEAYKIRTNWSAFASYIYPLSSYTDEPFEMESVDLGLSVKWASCNIGAYSPEQYGTYFAWGDVVGQIWDGSSWSGGDFYSYPDYELDANNNLKPGYDAAHVNLGDDWRMPTHAEQQELVNNCTCTWTSDYEGTGIAGRIFTSNKEGYTDKSIFLPAAGFGDDSRLDDAGSFGYYWSSTFISGFYAWSLYFGSDDVSTYYSGRNRGRSVRPVTE